MTELARLLLGAGAIAAVCDWIAVGQRRTTLERIFKPLALVLLIGVAVALDPHIEARRWAFVVALVFSLGGDVLLILNRFVPGLAAFLLAHVAYITGLRIENEAFGPLIFGGAIALVVAVIVGRPILNAVRAEHPELRTPVSTYIAVIAVMVASALASGEPLAATGAVVFMASDTLIAWNRFVRPVAGAPVAIMVTYHIAQALLILSLAL